MWLQILLTLLVVLFVIHYYIRGGRIGHYVNKMPGPPAYPLVGNLLSFMVPFDQLWQVVRKMNDDYYPLYRIWSTNVAVINLYHPDDAEVLLSSTNHIEKSFIYELLHPWFGTGLLTSTGTKWQHRRKILTPAFHFNVLQKYMDIIIENDERFIDTLKAKGESVQNLLPLITNYTLNVICEAAMGTSLQGKEELQARYRRAIHDMGNILVYRLVRPWLRWDRLFNLTPKGHEQKKALQVLHGFSTDIINERKEYHEKTESKFLNNTLASDESSKDNADTEVFGVRKRRLAMLDLLIAAYREKQIDDLGIREEVDTFMFEGHDTSAMGVCFVLLLLAEHKDIQARAREEVEEVLGKTGGRIDLSAINQMSHLERCIKEALRLYPSVPFISRNINEDLHLKDYTVPRGTIAHIHVYDLHRDANFWPEPLKYDPDRFLPERTRNRHPFSYIPFSAGSRNCIGQKFAMMELKSITAHLLHDFHLEPIDLAHEVPIVCDLVLRPARPIYMKFVPIEK
ncbi:cytochrome P450 4C1 [Nasonia vitripennis]|uniref:Cytochrome P450 n=1 Tax=Nasonia vitripennis TaxID=7425 RepID=A0A7M7M700_NASVI|nr:cytochrome P450 4C1 [Nasonia vitripennis]